MKKDADAENLTESIEKAIAGLFYISETDAPFYLFIGEKTNCVTAETILIQTGAAAGTFVEKRDFEEVFARLTRMQEWFGDEEKETAKRFAVLRDLLKTHLKDLAVFKVGEITVDIYMVGLDADGRLTGIKTKAVET